MKKQGNEANMQEKSPSWRYASAITTVSVTDPGLVVFYLIFGLPPLRSSAHQPASVQGSPD